MAKKSSSRKTSTKRGSQKRQRVNTGTDTRYVKRTSSGRFKESDDAGAHRRLTDQDARKRQSNPAMATEAIARRSADLSLLA